MIRLHQSSIALTLAAALSLGGCAKWQASMAHGWMSTVASAPKTVKPTLHRHATRVFRHAPKSAPRTVNPELVTGSVTPIAAPATPASVLQACKLRLYLETATSTEELRAAEAACKDIIVNQPFGGGAN